MTTQMTTAKKANRGHLLRAARAGRLYVKCTYHLTDDYARDNDNNGGRMSEFVQVYLREKFESSVHNQISDAHANGDNQDDIDLMVEQQEKESVEHDAKQRLAATGMITMGVWELRCSGGCVRGTTQSGQLSIHGNLSYEYEIR